MAGRKVRQYVYTDLAGKPKLRKLRMAPKAFCMESWVAGEHEFWARGIRPEQEAFADKAMYHLPELVWALRADELVWWSEGEKDADALRGVGAVATTHWQGALHATRDQARWFVQGHGPIRLAVDVDKSGAGAACAIERKRLLLYVGVERSRIQIVAPPRPHKDAAEAVEAGRPLTAFRKPNESAMTKLAADYTTTRRKHRESSDWLAS
ncbi:hypothetical protein [Nocardioides sp. cx-173]|uniref:hypothetical protein n=1 Tax=Nocardioides sp. cx-173 TaxID=2898796 RepID=UPI001E4D8CC3|nr:hypothetical protein [Nocardioides sp. cx-173]MCD4527454.1 hypothetical protein [Nocardioides sp. cx-173]UGB40406.1 hypothetical protein LQ940_13570 [Nocardioides sp. cx-173]